MFLEIGKKYRHPTSNEYWRYDSVILNFMGQPIHRAFLTIISIPRQAAAQVYIDGSFDQDGNIEVREGSFIEISEWPFQDL